MKIVIDIPEQAYNQLKEVGGVDWLDAENILDCVANGTPLPKGHGKLIDADALYADLTFPTQEFAKAFHEILEDAPGIVLPDKEVENDK